MFLWGVFGGQRELHVVKAISPIGPLYGDTSLCIGGLHVVKAINSMELGHLHKY